MEQTTKSIATNYGLYLGAILAALTVIAYAAYIDLFTKWWFGVISAIIIIVFGVLSIAKSKTIQNGFISFKEAFTSYFLTVIVALTISAIVSYILFNFIDPEAAETIKQKTIETTINMMEGFGAPAESVAEAVDQMENQDQFAIGNVFKGLAIQTVIFSIIGLIVALIMKRNPEAS